MYGAEEVADPQAQWDTRERGVGGEERETAPDLGFWNLRTYLSSVIASPKSWPPNLLSQKVPHEPVGANFIQTNPRSYYVT